MNVGTSLCEIVSSGETLTELSSEKLMDREDSCVGEAEANTVSEGNDRVEVTSFVCDSENDTVMLSLGETAEEFVSEFAPARPIENVALRNSDALVETEPSRLPDSEALRADEKDPVAERLVENDAERSMLSVADSSSDNDKETVSDVDCENVVVNDGDDEPLLDTESPSLGVIALTVHSLESETEKLTDAETL